MAEEKIHTVKVIHPKEDARNKEIKQLRDDLSEANSKIESILKDLEKCKSMISELQSRSMDGFNW